MINRTNSDEWADSVRDTRVPIGAFAMGDGPQFEARMDAVSAIVRYRILQLVAIAKRELGHRATAEDAELALMRESMPTFATALVLTGAVRCPIDDGRPWFGHFYDPRQRCFALPRLSAGQVRRQVTATLLRRAARRWVAHFGRYSRIDDRFRILDQFDRVVMIGELLTRQRGGRRRRRSIAWLPLPDRSALEDMKQQAVRYEDEAREERRWDNFSTARHLEDMARALRDAASCAQVGINLIP